MTDDDEYLSEGEIRGYVAVIRSTSKPDAGTNDAAVALIQDFCLRQWNRHPHSATTLDWLTESLGKLLEHQSAQEAFGVAKRAACAPKSAHKAQRDPLVVQWVNQACARGYKPSEARSMAADRFGNSVRNIERAHEHWTVTETEADWERIFLSMGRPLPPRR